VSDAAGSDRAPLRASTGGQAGDAARWLWLGRVPFAAAVEAQEAIRGDVLGGRGPETLLLLEHDPVITLGRRAASAHLLASPAELGRRGIAVARASRGGDITYHGPGQLVGYPIVRLSPERGVVGHLRAMADGLCAVLARHGVTAAWRRETPGLWIAGGDRAADQKICAFGVHVHRRVAIHGFALNLTVDLEAFRLIVPCGLAGTAVTSVEAITGRAPRVQDVAAEVAAAFSGSFGRPFVPA